MVSHAKHMRKKELCNERKRAEAASMHAKKRAEENARAAREARGAKFRAFGQNALSALGAAALCIGIAATGKCVSDKRIEAENSAKAKETAAETRPDEKLGGQMLYIRALTKEEEREFNSRTGEKRGEAQQILYITNAKE